MPKIKLKLNKTSELIDMLDDLTKIDDKIKLKIDNDNILLYSALMSGQTTLAFKNYLIDTKEYLTYKGDLEFNIDVILINAKKFVKNLKFINSDELVSMEIEYKDSSDDENIKIARKIQISSGKLKVNWITGEQFTMKDMTKNILKKVMDIKKRKWSFTIEQSEFLDIKKLASINSERIINIIVKNSKITISEKSAWELEINEIEGDVNVDLMINKKFLNSIDSNNNVLVNIFETFMLITTDNSNLMLSYEQDFEDNE